MIDDMKERLNQAMAYMTAGEYAMAENLFREIIEKDNQDPEIYMHMGNALISQNKIEDGIKSFKTALMLRPENPIILFSIGSAYYLEDENAEAVKYLNQAEKAGLKNVDLHMIKMQIFIDEIDYIQAIREVSKAIRLEPFRIDLYERKVTLQIDMENYESAKETISELRELFPDALEGYVLETRILLIQKQGRQALELLNEALQKFPQDLNVLHLKMKVLEYLNQNEEALRIADYLLEQKIAEEARSETAIYKADILAKLGRTEEVKLFLKNYCAQNKDEELFYLLMMIYVGDRNYKYAANIANLLTEFAETSIYLATAKFTLAEAAKYNNDLEGAKEQYRKLSREFRKLTIDHPELYEVYIFRILCHVEVQEYENAMELADYLEHAYPGMSDGPLYKYYIYKTMGKMNMAEIEKKKALKINPDIRIQW